ncbi:MAG: DUF4105 domain-containing protein [Bacteroides sp.]|nr:DUF4105 domain-containing protein [Bacteroides sp.]
MATILLVLPPCAYASDSIASRVIPEITVSLLTCAPGSDIYELEGHTGLRLSSKDFDFVVNWGLFDFDSPGFVYRFVKGETDYMVGASPTDRFLAYYSHTGRAVTEQTLNLDSIQALRVYQLVGEALQGDPHYRYNYVKDNCALRPLRLLQKAIAPDSLALGKPDLTEREASTFRRAMTSYHNHYPWYQFGIDLALGSGIDRTLDEGEIAFAPVALSQMMAGASIIAPSGKSVPAVTATTQPVAGAPGGVVLPSTPWYLTPMTAAILIMLITAFFTWADMVRRIITRWFDACLFGLYGLAGCIIAFLVIVSVHEATSPNYLLLWLNPFCLLVTALIWSPGGRRFLLYYHYANLAALIAMCILMPVMNQTVNLAFIPLVIADAMRSLSYIYVTRCERKRKKRRNRYQIKYSAYSSCR